jgi:hypothetical protein
MISSTYREGYQVDVSSKLGSYWDCSNNHLDLEARDVKRVLELIAGEKCGHCGEVLTEVEYN